jgi:hypothetical protein
MPLPRRRKSVQLRKQKKLKVVKRITSKQRKQSKKHTAFIILDSGKLFKRVGVKQQWYDRKYDRIYAKRKYLRKEKLSKENKKLLSYVKKYKSGVAKKYTREMVIAMKKRGYFAPEINWAKRYSVVGQNVQRSIANAEKYLGKRISKKKQAAKIKRAVRTARIKSYQDILGVTKEKAKKILNIIDKKLPGVNELKALIY